MNVDGLIDKYFKTSELPVSIEVFDSASIFEVYSDIVKVLKSYTEIEISVLQALSYCFYEVLDNVLTHSGKICGTVLMRYLQSDNVIKILVADDGVGIQKSLSVNPKHRDISEQEALALCLKDTVTDGKGLGFGLYTTARLVQDAGIRLEIRSGHSVLNYDGTSSSVTSTDFWQGTIVYFEIHSNREINPNDVVEGRTDCEEEFNETFLEDGGFDDLW